MFNHLLLPLPLQHKILEAAMFLDELLLEPEEVVVLAAALQGEITPPFILVTNALPEERERELRKLKDWNDGKPISGDAQRFKFKPAKIKFTASEGKLP